MKITASIVLYHNNVQELNDAIASCLSSEMIFKLFLIDNSATDAFKKLAIDTRVVYQHNSKNIGFGAAHNVAIQKALEESTYHIVLNPDVSFAGEILDELKNFMEGSPEIGAVMPQVLYKDGSVQRLCKLLPSPLNLFGRRFANSIQYFKNLNKLYELEQFQYDKILDVPNLSGCFMFLRVSTLKQVGGFDPRYFMYLEDVDLVRRIGQVNRTVFYPQVFIYHGYQKGSYSGKKLLFIHIKSAIKYFNKWGWFKDKQRIKVNEKLLNYLKE